MSSDDLLPDLALNQRSSPILISRSVKPLKVCELSASLTKTCC